MGEIADDALEGFACSWCGIYFEEPHGYPVLCQTCYGKQGEGDLPLATEKELG